MIETKMNSFINDMAWNMLEWEKSELEEILKSVCTDYSTLEALENELEYGEWEMDYHFCDVNLSSLMDYLTESGLSKSEILDKINAIYDGVRLYYLSKDEMYCMTL